jgi:hypothetical protein
MTSFGASSSAKGVEREPQDREPAARGDEKAAEKWASTLAASVLAKLPPPPPPLQSDIAAPAVAWRSGDGSLTQCTAATPGGESATPDNSRIALSIDAADLGKLSVVVDRTSAGVRVLIGVEGDHAASAIDPQTAALARALSGLGLTVSSVSVVRRDALGTDLAQRTQKPASAADDSNQREANRARESRQRKRRINLIG